jgi:arylsulfatase A-like enzyme
VTFLRSRKDKEQPFFAYVTFQTPHDPKQCPDAYKKRYLEADLPLPEAYKPEHPFDNGMLKIRDEKLAKFPRGKDEIRRHVAEYYAMITHTDDQIGKILKALDETGKRNNTIIVFAADNGLAVGKHGLMGKQNCYEHSLHFPGSCREPAGSRLPPGQRP